MIQQLNITGLLSFKDLDLELRPLNVLIGPNGSGKSNLIEVLSLLRAAPEGRMGDVISQGGSVSNWLWKGASAGQTAALSVAVDGIGTPTYFLRLAQQEERYVIAEEELSGISTTGEPGQEYFRVVDGKGVIHGRRRLSGESPDAQRPAGEFVRESIELDNMTPGRSVLHERRDPEIYPEVSHVAKAFAAIRLYRDWRLGPHAPARRWQPTDLPGEFLAEDTANLAVVVNEFEFSNAMPDLEDEFRRLFDGFRGFATKVAGGQVQLFMREEGLDEPTPATRWSDGMLRYLCLLVILCHPSPPPLICIEEPELGLHPDILPSLAKLLIEASERTQLIVTTHSDLLVDEFTDMPEAVVVCERPFGTHTDMQRLDRDKLSGWLERYRLGEVWRSGEIGGNRW